MNLLSSLGVLWWIEGIGFASNFPPFLKDYVCKVGIDALVSWTISHFVSLSLSGMPRLVLFLAFYLKMLLWNYWFIICLLYFFCIYIMCFYFLGNYRGSFHLLFLQKTREKATFFYWSWIFSRNTQHSQFLFKTRWIQSVL